MKTGQRKEQGDVILIKLDALPKNAVAQEFKKKVLQESEVTGHHHHFRPTAKVDLYTDSKLANAGKTITPNLGKIIVVHEDSELYHGRGFDAEPAKKGTGDHKSQVIPAGVYRIDIVREYDYDRLETARVVD